MEKMRRRNNKYEGREKYEVKLTSLNHKINRLGKLHNEYRFYEDDYYNEDNWMLKDEHYRKMNMVSEAILETIKTPVGGWVRRDIVW